MRTMKVEAAAPVIFLIVLAVSVMLNMLSPRVELEKKKLYLLTRAPKKFSGVNLLRAVFLEDILKVL